MINLETDNLERDLVQAGTNSFCLQKIILFENWVETRFGSMDKFDALSKKDKEKVFLRWKWGFNDERTNEELELNEQGILFRFKDDGLSKFSEGVKFHIENKRQYDRICYETKKRIGLIFQSSPLAEKVAKIFDAKPA